MEIEGGDRATTPSHKDTIEGGGNGSGVDVNQGGSDRDAEAFVNMSSTITSAIKCEGSYELSASLAKRDFQLWCVLVCVRWILCSVGRFGGCKLSEV